MGTVVFTGCWLAAGAFEPGYDSSREFISALASDAASHAVIMVLGFLAAAVGTLAASWLALRALGSRTIAAVLATSGALLAVAGLVRQRCSTVLRACEVRVRSGPALSATNLHGVAATLMFVAALSGLVLI